MRTLTGTLGARLTAAVLAAGFLGACGRPAPAEEAQTGAAPEPAARGTTPSSSTVDAGVPSEQGEQGGQSEAMADQTQDGGDAPTEPGTAVTAPVLTADDVAGVVDSTPGRAGVKITSQNPIVAPTPTTAPPAVGENGPTGTGGVHVVEPGDTLSVIAATYDVPIQAIADANGLVDVDNLKPGQELQIPAAN